LAGHYDQERNYPKSHWCDLSGHQPVAAVAGHDVANSIGSQFTKAFTGAPMGRATHYFLAGTVLGLFGGFLLFWKRK
jgi:hypothetical protein